MRWKHPRVMLPVLAVAAVATGAAVYLATAGSQGDHCADKGGQIGEDGNCVVAMTEAEMDAYFSQFGTRLDCSVAQTDEVAQFLCETVYRDTTKSVQPTEGD